MLTLTELTRRGLLRVAATLGGAATGITIGGVRTGIATAGQENTGCPPPTLGMPHRHSILKSYYEISWQDPHQDDEQLSWVRGIYRSVHADTGGVPLPNSSNDGAFINYADTDLADPQWNLSGVPWHTLYYRDNYPRLQHIKARWDPRNIFCHALSIVSPS